MKRCTKCKTEKPPEDFGKNRGEKDGLQSWCKSCASALAKFKWASATAEQKDQRNTKVRAFSLKKKYGLTVAQYEAILVSQDFKCAICDGRLRFKGSRSNQTACVDHCHQQGKVRGVLCNGCNVTIGKFQDSSAMLRKAAEYLEKHNKPDSSLKQ